MDAHVSMWAIWIVLASALLPGAGSAGPGALDPSFGREGIVLADLGGREDFASAAALQPDGKLIVASADARWPWERDAPRMVRFDASGGLDPTFGAGGVGPPVFAEPASVVDVLPQADGRVVVIATVQLEDERDAVAVARLLPDGSPDSSLGVGGRLVVGWRVFGTAARWCGTIASAGALDRAGRVLVSGTSGCGGEDGWTEGSVARLTASGALDTGFAGDGAREIADECGSYAVAAGPDGAPVVVGSSGSGDYCADGPMAAVRLRPDGRRDVGFGVRGRARVRFPRAGDSGAAQVVIDPRGRIVLAGWAAPTPWRRSGGSALALARLTASGHLDRSFAERGRYLNRRASGSESSVTRLRLTSAGWLVVAGETRPSYRAGHGRVFVARLDARGRLDTRFAGTGLRDVTFGGAEEHPPASTSRRRETSCLRRRPSRQPRATTSRSPVCWGSRQAVRPAAAGMVSMTPDRLGLLIGAAFGLIYVVINGGELDAPVGPLLQAAGILAFLGVLVALRRRPPARPSGTPRGGGFGRGYGLVVAAEVVAIVAGIALLNGPLDLEHGVLPWVSLVVGVHFLALARVWHAPSLAWTGGAIALLGAIGLGLAVGDASKTAIAVVAGVGPGVMLLAGSLWAATR